MKKVLCLLIISMFIFGLVACGGADNEINNGTTGQATPTPTDAPATPTPEGAANGTTAMLKDGIYDGEGEPWQYGKENATVEIAAGKIKAITLRRLDKAGNEVNYDDYAGQEKDGKKYPNLKQDRIDMADAMIKKQSWDVDTISGATISTQNWKTAVKKALDMAK